ncbi:MAG: hypothetical protein CMK92_02775 [Pseudomonas sp.]|nr:hypothetical protein [Pseudomonas sp.]
MIRHFAIIVFVTMLILATTTLILNSTDIDVGTRKLASYGIAALAGVTAVTTMLTVPTYHQMR